MKRNRTVKIMILSVIMAMGIMSHTVFGETVTNLTPEEIFTYGVYYGGGAVITGFQVEMSGIVEIPETIGGNEVVGIDGYAFDGNTTVTEFVLPEGLKQLGLNAFHNCTALERIYIPASTTAFTESALSGCSSLKSIVVDEDNPVYDSRNNCNAIIDKRNNELIIGCRNSTIPNTVVGIGKNSFSGQKNLKSIVIPKSVTYIGPYAFTGCEQLESVRIPANVKTIDNHAFTRCKGMKELKIENGVESIGTYAFGGCIGLTELRLPKSVVKISINAFADTHLKEVYLTKSVPWFKNNVYLEKAHLAEGIKVIPDNVFEGCTSLTTVELPSTLKSIEDEVFIDCTGLIQIDIPASVDSIGKRAFMRCDGLEQIIIPQNVELINEYTFAGCSNLEKVVLPSGLKEIHSYAFRACEKLGNIDFPKSLTTIGANVFEECNSMTEVVLPASLTEIGRGNFYNCKGLEAVDFTGSLTKISDRMFYGCENLETVILPEKLKEIENYSFSGCTKLNGIELSTGLETIGDGAFRDCRSLEGIAFPATIKYIGSETFYNCILIKEVELPYGIKTLAGSIFENCEALESVKLPYSIEEIGWDAFKGCKSLTEITLPPSVKTMGIKMYPNPFTSVETIYGEAGSYAETFAEQNGITFIPVVMTHEHCWEEIIQRATPEENGFRYVICRVCGEKTEEEQYYSPVVTIDKTKYAYTGKIITPEITVKDTNGSVLQKGTDYDVTCSGKCINAGDYKVTVTFNGNYEGTVTEDFIITTVHINKAAIYGLKDKIYNGKKQVQNITVKYGGKVVPVKITYSLNRTDIGTRYVTITSKDKNVTGSIKKSYKILPAKSSISSLKAGKKMFTVKYKIIYDGCEYQVAYKLKSADKWIYKNVIGQSKKITGLKANKKYNVKVRAFKLVNGTKYYGAWSTVKTVKTK